MRSLCNAILLAMWCSALAATVAYAQPANYPRAYQQIVDAAAREASLSIWSVTDTASANALINGFRRRYPGIRVDYLELPAQTLYDRFLIDANSNRGTADFLWSSAMDLQIKLVNDGYSQSYVSPEKSNLPDWAVWKNEAWGITAEPIVFAYNRRLMAAYPKVPGTHPDLLRFLTRNSRSLRGKVATYDPAVSAVGYLYLAQDKHANHNTWDLVRAMGQADARLYPTTEAILDELASGRLAFAYDMIGSYALKAQARNPQIGVIVPRDYTLVMSRIAMIPARARHPNAARLFLDYLLSRHGQSLLIAQHMTPVRTDVALPASMRVNALSARAIRVGPALLVHQDQLTRAKFLRDWNRAMAGR